MTEMPQLISPHISIYHTFHIIPTYQPKRDRTTGKHASPDGGHTAATPTAGQPPCWPTTVLANHRASHTLPAGH